MPRTLVIVVVVLTVLIGLVAVDSFAADPPSSDIAPGWHFRLDAVNNSESEQVRFVEEDGGFLASNGPNVVFFRPDNTVRGRYSLTVGVHHLDSLHPHGAGLMFGGSDLSGAAQAYSYFLVRDDGFFLIKTRRGDTTEEITPWTEHDAVRPGDANGIAKNLLRVDVGTTETRFFVNGVEVHRASNASLPTDGLFGFRMVHDLKVRFADFLCAISD